MKCRETNGVMAEIRIYRRGHSGDHVVAMLCFSNGYNESGNGSTKIRQGMKRRHQWTGTKIIWTNKWKWLWSLMVYTFALDLDFCQDVLKWCTFSTWYSHGAACCSCWNQIRLKYTSRWSLFLWFSWCWSCLFLQYLTVLGIFAFASSYSAS